jgi:hypothetical protein
MFTTYEGAESACIDKLIDFLKHIKSTHTDKYGNLQICVEDDELVPTAERIVEDYLNSTKTEVEVQAEDAEYLITITRPAYGSPNCWYNDHVGKTFRAVLDEDDANDDDTEYYRICNDEPIVKEIGIGSLYVCNVQGYIPDYDVTEIIKEN